MMEKSNIFSNISTNLDAELFENIVNKESFKLQRIVSQGHTTPEGEWYDQDEDEWVMLESGEAILSFENGEDVHLQAGEHLNIKAHKKHRVSWTKPDAKTIWLALYSQPLA